MEGYKKHLIYEPYETIEEQEDAEERIRQEFEKAEDELFNKIEVIKKLESIEEENKRWFEELFMELGYN